MVCKEMLEVLATQGTPQAVFAVWAGVRKVATFRTPAHTAKMYPLLAGYSQGSSGRRVTLLAGTSFLHAI